MAADQGIQIADDGTPEVAMTHARANLTQLLREVRYGKKPAAFTERGERSAYVVPPEFYEQAESDRRFRAAFHEVMEQLPPAERPQKLLELLVKKIDELD
ncbi:type II toxin-antitoxin system prevent-host-death family antitoxin [Streptomyces sp. NPDC007148]|uniref:type II toxin-antitoxin system prevent-host-death family antitoxin n=1 Tax=Streptomyces sp. NPDC007148 TaxID=3364775 RepID=UPI0036CEAE6D